MVCLAGKTLLAVGFSVTQFTSDNLSFGPTSNTVLFCLNTAKMERAPAHQLLGLLQNDIRGGRVSMVNLVYNATKCTDLFLWGRRESTEKKKSFSLSFTYLDRVSLVYPICVIYIPPKNPGHNSLHDIAESRLG